MGTDTQVGANSGRTIDVICSLMVMEADEVFMANFGRGWRCGGSNGEGLSRVLSNDIYRGAQTPDWVAANVWLDMKSRPDCVSRNDSTDGRLRSWSRVSHFALNPGYGSKPRLRLLFLNWLRFQLRYGWREIIAAGGGTLSATYLHLTGKRTGWGLRTHPHPNPLPPRREREQFR